MLDNLDILLLSGVGRKDHIQFPYVALIPQIEQ